jgi:hypothetical protein
VRRSKFNRKPGRCRTPEKEKKEKRENKNEGARVDFS